MTTSTPNLGLICYNSTTDATATFLTWRTDVDGVSTSNMTKIDSAYGTQAAQIAALQAIPQVIVIPATFSSSNFYVATGISSFPLSYLTNQLIVLYLDTTSSGTVTLNINSLGTKSVMKVNSSGTVVNLTSSDLSKNRPYLFRYDGTEWVWVNATSGDSITTDGTSGNFIKINTDNTLIDSGVADSSLVHLSGTETITGAKTFNLPPNYATQTVSGTATLASASAPVVLTDTTSAGYTLNLPASPATGEWFYFIDNTSQWATHNLTISPNGKNIDGSSSNFVLATAGASIKFYYDGTQWHREGGTVFSTTTHSGLLPTLSGTSQNYFRGDGNYGIINYREGFVTNYQILPSVSSNNLTLALKTAAGNDPSSSDPIYVRLGNSIKSITSALSLTMSAATNWMNLGSAELATQETDIFAGLLWDSAASAVRLTASRYPGGNIYGDYSSTSTNEKYMALSGGTPASTDSIAIIGRFAATLSGGAGYTWSIPTYTADNLKHEPIFETRWLYRLPNFDTTTIDNGSGGQPPINECRYKIVGTSLKTHISATGTKVGTSANWVITSSPFTIANTSGQPGLGTVFGYPAVTVFGVVSQVSTAIYFTVNASIPDNTVFVTWGASWEYEI